MKFIIQRDQLIDNVQHVMKAISSRTTIPILTGIKIIATNEGLTFTGSDSDISIESFVPKEEDGTELVEIKQSGGVVLNARFFSEIVRKLPEDTVEIEVLGHHQTIIRSGQAEFNLNGQDHDEYPHLPQIDEKHVFSLQADLLKTLIRQTVFAVSTSETRPILTGVNWEIEKGVLTCAATDSHRLAVRTTPVDIDESVAYNAVIPGKSLLELSKILDDTSDLVEIIFTENQVIFKSKHLLFFSRRLEGNYPDTSRLIPTDNKTNLVLDSKEFLHAIDRASLLARAEKNNVVKLATVENQTIEISSNTPEIGNVMEQIKSHSIEGEELKISFSAKYMMDALKALEGSEVKINFTGAMRPFVIRSVGDDTILQLILPVRTF